jgi:hypothetical protein
VTVRGCLFVLLVAGAVAAILVAVALPAVAAGAVTTAVTAAGLQSSDTTVTVTSDAPTDLVGLHADHVRIRATSARFKTLQIGVVDVTLNNVAILDRTVGSVEGRLQAVVLTALDSGKLTLQSITLAGPGDAIVATTTVPAAEATRLIADGIGSVLGGIPASVTLASPSRLTVRLGGVAINGSLGITAAGDLVARVTDGPAAGQEVTLVRGGVDMPIRLTQVSVASGGALVLSGFLSFGLLG